MLGYKVSFVSGAVDSSLCAGIFCTGGGVENSFMPNIYCVKYVLYYHHFCCNFNCVHFVVYLVVKKLTTTGLSVKKPGRN